MTITAITADNFTRINNDVNGNPRYVIHFLDLLNDEDVNLMNHFKEKGYYQTDEKYNYAVKKAKKIGGKKYSTKAYGGGIVFQSYNLPDLVKSCNELLTIKN